MKKVLLIISTVFVLIVATYFADKATRVKATSSIKNTQQVEAKIDGKPAPEVKFKDLDGKDVVADKFGGLLGYPTGFLITRDGKVVKKFQGLTSFDEIAKAIESQL